MAEEKKDIDIKLHAEKSTMQQPQEEFIEQENIPSKDKSELTSTEKEELRKDHTKPGYS